jgi:Porin subfamily
MRGAGTILAILVTATANCAALASAQTLKDPDPKRAPPVSGQSQSQARERAKACAEFGAGFVQVPGTDACVKIGGFVTVEGSDGR